MNNEKKRFILFILLLVCFTCTAYFVGVGEQPSHPESEETEESEKAVEKNGEETETTLSSVMSTAAETDFFTDYRISREKQRDAAAEALRTVAEDATREEKARAEADASLQRLLAENTAEDNLEKILLGRNYEDALFIYNETMPILILKKQQLSPTETGDLKKFVGAYLGIGADTVSVFTVWNEKTEP